MFLSQARRTSDLHVVAVTDLSPEKARAALQRVGWSENEFGARSFADAVKHRTAFVSDDTLLSRIRSHDRQSGNYSALYRPYHLIGLELGISVASVVLRGESTVRLSIFAPTLRQWRSAISKPGNTLDGEGGLGRAYSRR